MKYPGDEWDNPKACAPYADRYLKPFLLEDLTGIAIEIGQGLGKYTLEVIDKVKGIICYDISKAFMKTPKDTLYKYIEKSKIEFEQLKLCKC